MVGPQTLHRLDGTALGSKTRRRERTWILVVALVALEIEAAQAWQLKDRSEEDSAD